MKQILITLILISVTPWAFGQIGNTAEHLTNGNDMLPLQYGDGNYAVQSQGGYKHDATQVQVGDGNYTRHYQQGIANLAVSTIIGNYNNSVIIQH